MTDIIRLFVPRAQEPSTPIRFSSPSAGILHSDQLIQEQMVNSRIGNVLKNLSHPDSERPPCEGMLTFPGPEVPAPYNAEKGTERIPHGIAILGLDIF